MLELYFSLAQIIRHKDNFMCLSGQHGCLINK